MSRHPREEPGGRGFKPATLLESRHVTSLTAATFLPYNANSPLVSSRGRSDVVAPAKLATSFSFESYVSLSLLFARL